MIAPAATPSPATTPGEHLLVTGGAGFIGSHLVDRLLAAGCHVTVVDNFDPFYAPALKERNVATHLAHPRYRLLRADIRDLPSLRAALTADYAAIFHLAARPGVRASFADPAGCRDVNLQGTRGLLEFARERRIPRFLFASSSSVYGVNPHVPWRESEPDLRPISPYAEAKLAAEQFGRDYAATHGLRFTALRFFTVYGPRQRPDLAISKFAGLLRQGRPLPFYGDGSTRRDYTFVADTVSGLLAALRYEGDDHHVFNLGNDATVSLAGLVAALETAFGRRATLERLPDQPGDVPQTWADLGKSRRLLGYAPATDLATGLAAFRRWLESDGTEPAEAPCHREPLPASPGR